MDTESNSITSIEITQRTISEMIYTIRGQKVILDIDLARIYGYTTKAFNQQVKRNLAKFPERYMFQITYEEIAQISRSQIVTPMPLMQEFGVKGGRTYLPYVFTEQGVYMLMTILKGDLATNQSIALIDTFKKMKDIIIESKGMIVNTNPYIESRFNAIDERIQNAESKINTIMEGFVDPSMQKHFLILDGCKVEADIAYQSIYSTAKHSIILIDDYIGLKTLEMLKSCPESVSITIISDNVAKKGITQSHLDDFRSDTGLGIELKPTRQRVHDRYVVIDYGFEGETIFHCGASSKDAGGRITTIMKIEYPEDYHRVIDMLLSDE